MSFMAVDEQRRGGGVALLEEPLPAGAEVPVDDPLQRLF
jgi:hypothetical protein